MIPLAAAASTAGEIAGGVASLLSGSSKQNQQAVKDMTAQVQTSIKQNAAQASGNVQAAIDAVKQNISSGGSLGGKPLFTSVKTPTGSKTQFNVRALIGKWWFWPAIILIVIGLIIHFVSKKNKKRRFYRRMSAAKARKRRTTRR